MLPTILGSAVAFCLAPAPPDEAAKAAKQLEGTYIVVEYLVGGGKPNPKGRDDRQVVIKDGTITFKENGAKDEPIKFRLDPSKKPARLYPLTDKKSGDSDYWIYEVRETKEGTELLIAANLSFGDKGIPPPSDFKGENGIVFRLRKKGK